MQQLPGQRMWPVHDMGPNVVQGMYVRPFQIVHDLYQSKRTTTSGKLYHHHIIQYKLLLLPSFRGHIQPLV